jgi:integrase/recombinase XerD
MCCDEVKLENFKNYLVKETIKIIYQHSKTNIPRFSTGVKIELNPLNKEKTIVYRHYLACLEGKRFSKSTIANYRVF